jgi:galactokinase
MDAIVYGNIPGGGMSRSASLSLNLIESILELNGYFEIPRMDIVNLAQMVEVDYIGSPCGKLDQVMIYFARAGMSTYFNPVNEHIEHFKLRGEINGYRVVCLDTGTKRAGLEVSTDKVRCQQCDRMNAFLHAELGRPLSELFKNKNHYRGAAQLLQSELPDCMPLLRYFF